MGGLDVSALPTPAYVVDEAGLIENLKLLKYVADTAGCKILLAQKAFSMFRVYPLIGEYLSGTTASGLFEARLGRECMNKENHIFAPAYSEKDFEEIIKICDHIIFNTPSQWHRFKKKALEAGVSCGLRVNPEYSEIETDIYNPCFTGSRLGTTLGQLKEGDLEGLEGLHFHTMCEQGSETLKRTLEVVEAKFGPYLHGMRWINFGGGHHITRPGYNVALLIDCVQHMKKTYDVEVYLEPGEAVALNAGWLVSQVMDTLDNDIRLAIMDTSAACHMPDVLEMPYRPMIAGSGQPGEKPWTYRLGGPTCLAGDIIGDYSFEEPLRSGDRLVFEDMAIYTMVKNNTFNGINLPAILLKRKDGTLEVVKTFDYQDFKNRLS